MIDRPIRLINLSWLKFEWTLDTIGNPKNQDKLFANMIRVWALIGWIVVVTNDFGFIMELTLWTFSLIFIGIIEVRFFRDNCKSIKIKVW